MEINLEALEEGLRVDWYTGAESPWGRYPYIDNGEEIWIPTEDLRFDQLTELSDAVKAIGRRKIAEANELRRFAL